MARFRGPFNSAFAAFDWPPRCCGRRDRPPRERESIEVRGRRRRQSRLASESASLRLVQGAALDVSWTRGRAVPTAAPFAHPRPGTREGGGAQLGRWSMRLPGFDQHIECVLCGTHEVLLERRPRAIGDRKSIAIADDDLPFRVIDDTMRVVTSGEAVRPIRR